MRLPIRCKVITNVLIPADPEKVEHLEFMDTGFVPEEKIVEGFYMAPITLLDAQEGQVLGDGVYVEFWEDHGEYYKVSFVDYNNIQIDAKEVRNYIAKIHSTGHGV
jgi:hypothetical protein